MHLGVRRLTIYIAALSAIREAICSNTGHWHKVLEEDSHWRQNSPSCRGDIFSAQRSVTYRRKANPSQAQTRILFVDYQGVTWTYSQETTSWTTLSTVNELTRLKGNSITSLCETTVVAFGGYQEVVDSDINVTKSFNENARLLIFSGESEEWTFLQNPRNGPQARFSHKAFTQYKKESRCQCKESMFVYGGFSVKSSGTYLDDFWELRCVDEQSMKYRWIEIDTRTWPRYFPYQQAFTIDSENIHWISGYNKTLSILSLSTKKWNSKLINSSCSGSAYFSNRENMVYAKGNKLLIFSLEGYQLGVYDVNKSRFHCVEINVDPTVDEAGAGKILLVKNKLLLVTVKRYRAEIKLSVLETAELLKLSNNNQSDSKANFQEIIPTGKYPLFNGKGRVVKISDSIWYLILNEGHKIAMWRFEKDHLRWTLYDPDQSPDQADAHFLAYSATENNCVAIFGTDRLWLYSTNLRIWTKVLYVGSGPNNLTSYATMNAMKNGSLLLFGGIDNKAGSLWIATVDFKHITVTWQRICCNGRKMTQEPQRGEWSSTIWNNTFNVYFLQIGDSCEWKTYQAQLGIGDCKWNVTLFSKERMPARSKIMNNFCGRSSTTIGRFVVTADASGNLLIEDLSRAKMKVMEETRVVSFIGAKSLIFSSGKTIFSLVVLWNTSQRKNGVFGLESFQLPGCEPGTNSSDYSIYPCSPCPKGQYSDDYGATNCTDCPTGLLTRTTGSTSKENCTCPVGKCANGKCIVQSDHTTYCICNTGFTGELCDIPRTYLLGMGTIVTAILIAAFLYCLKRVKNIMQKAAEYTRVELEIAEETVAELSDIWSVDENEVEFERMIGKGSFGDVWTAQYRDQTVAVKVLKIREQDCTNEQVQEFKDESELLRSIFHAHMHRSPHWNRKDVG